MAQGQKITVNNTGLKQITISYQKLSDLQWIYNESIRPGQVKTIWVVTNTLSSSDPQFISGAPNRFVPTIDDFEFIPRPPRTTLSPTQTPTKTPTPIAPRTICLSVTEELTWDVTTTSLGLFNGKPYFGLYYPGNILIPNYFIKWNSSLQRWELVTNGLSDTTPNSILTNSQDPNIPIGIWTPLVNPYTLGMVVNSSFLCSIQSTPTPTPTPIPQKCYAFSNITVNWPNSGTNCQRPKNLKTADLASYVLRRDDTRYAVESFTESCINCNEWNKGYGNPTPESLQYINRYTPVQSTFNVGDLVYLGKNKTDCLLLTEREGWYFIGSLGCAGETIYVSTNGVILAKGKCGGPQPKLIEEPKNTYITINYIDCCGIERTTRFDRGSGDQTTYVINGSIKAGSVKSLDNPNAILDVKYFTEINNCSDCCSTPTPTTTKTPTPTPTSASKVKVVLTCCAALDTNTSNIEVDLPFNFDPEAVYLDDLGIGWYYAGPNLVKTSNYKPKTLESIGTGGIIEGCLKIAEANGTICPESDPYPFPTSTPTPTPSVGLKNIYLIGCCCNEGYIIKPNAPLISSPNNQFIPNQLYTDSQGNSWISISEPSSGITLTANINYNPSWFKWVDTNNKAFDFCSKYCEAVECKPFNVTATPTPTSTPTVTPTLTNVNNSYCHTITNTGSTTCIIKWIDRYLDKNEVCIQTGETLTICAIVGSVETNCLSGNTVIVVTGSTCKDASDCLPTPTPSATPTSTPNPIGCKEFIVSLNVETYLKYAEAVGITGPGPEPFSIASEIPEPTSIPYTSEGYYVSYIDCCGRPITILVKYNEPTKICAQSVPTSIFYNSLSVGSCSGSCVSNVDMIITQRTLASYSAVTCDGQFVSLNSGGGVEKTDLLLPGRYNITSETFGIPSKCFQKNSFISSNTGITFDYYTTNMTTLPCDCTTTTTTTATPTSTPTPTTTPISCGIYQAYVYTSWDVTFTGSGFTFTFEYVNEFGQKVYDTVNPRETKFIRAGRPPVSQNSIFFSYVGPCGATPTPTSTPTTTPTSTPCVCPSGYTYDPIDERCFRSITVPPITATTSFMPGAGDASIFYGGFGFRVYAVNGYDINGINTLPLAFNGGNTGPKNTFTPQQLFWANRMNLNLVWVEGQPEWPTPFYPGMVSFCANFNIPSEKIYYIGIGGDNDVRVILNGQEIIQQPTNLIESNFDYWHLYPVTIPSGQTEIILQGWNRSIIGGFAAEIYDNTLPEIIAATGTSMVDIVFSTGDYLGQRNSYIHTPTGFTEITVSAGSKVGESFCSLKYCPFNFSATGEDYNFQCVGFEFVDCGLNPTPTPTPTITPTQRNCYSTVTFNPNPYLNPYVSYYDCCEGIIKSIILQSGVTSFTATKGCIQEGSFRVPSSNGSNQQLNYSYLNPCDCEPPVVPFCEECNLGFSSFRNNLPGVIEVGNLTGTCGITDYLITWYGPDSNTNVAFTSGIGTSFSEGYNIGHPFVRPSLTGLYKPVVTKVKLASGVILDNLSGNCFQNITVVDIDCNNGNNTQSGNTNAFNIYSHEYQFQNASYLRPPQTLRLQMSLGLSTNYLAFYFNTYLIDDTLKITFLSDEYEMPIVLENVVLKSSGGRFVTPELSQKTDVGEMRKILTLTGLTRDVNDKLLIEITPNQSNPQTNWTLFLKCLTNFSQNLCEDGKLIPYKIITESPRSAAGGCNVFPRVMISGCTISDIQNTDVHKYLGPVSYSPPSTVDVYPGIYNIYMVGLKRTSATCMERAWSFGGDFCPAPINPDPSRRITLKKQSGNLMLEFASFSDFERYYGTYIQMRNKLDSFEYVNDPSSLKYWKYIQLTFTATGDELEICGDGTGRKKYVFHRSANVTTGQTPSTYFINIDLPIMNRQFDFSYGGCANCNNTIDLQNQRVNDTSNLIEGDRKTITNNNYLNPYYGFYIDVSEYFNDVSPIWQQVCFYESNVKTYPMSGNPLTFIPSLSGQAAPFSNMVLELEGTNHGSYRRAQYGFDIRIPEGVSPNDYNTPNYDIYSYVFDGLKFSGASAGVFCDPGLFGVHKVKSGVVTYNNLTVLDPKYYTSVSGLGQSIFIHIENQ